MMKRCRSVAIVADVEANVIPGVVSDRESNGLRNIQKYIEKVQKLKKSVMDRS